VEWHKNHHLKRHITKENFYFMLYLKTCRLFYLGIEILEIFFEIDEDESRNMIDILSNFGIAF